MASDVAASPADLERDAWVRTLLWRQGGKSGAAFSCTSSSAGMPIQPGGSMRMGILVAPLWLQWLEAEAQGNPHG